MNKISWAKIAEIEIKLFLKNIENISGAIEVSNICVQIFWYGWMPGKRENWPLLPGPPKKLEATQF